MTQAISTQKSAGYDNPAYTTRQSLQFGPYTAGSAGVTSKFMAHANLQAYSLNALSTVLGTSTYTFTGQNGSATVGVGADQLSLIVITNTASASSSVGLATTTYGPYVLGGQYVVSGTQTNQVGAFNQFQLNTNTGTAGLGGVVIPQGSQVYAVSGTDLTSVALVSVDYQIQPLAGFSA